MNTSIKRRCALIAMIALSQAICLCVGMAFFSSWLHRSMQQAVTDQVLADNIMVAGQMTKLIEQMNVSDLRENEASWSQMQAAIGDLTLPNDGFVCLVDADSQQLLCHPALEAHPLAAPNKPGMKKPTMIKAGMNKPIMIKAGMVKSVMNKSVMNK